MLRDLDDISLLLKKTSDALFRRWDKVIAAPADKILEVINLLSDDESKDTYCREIAYCAMRASLKNDLPSSYAGLMTDSDFQHRRQKVKDSQLHPEISCPPEGREWLEYYLTTTFINEGYQYKHHVGVHKGDICLDIGACLGDTSIWMLEKGARETWAFEIDKACLACLEKTRAANPLYQNIHPVAKAAHSRNGTFHFSANANQIGAGIITDDVGSRGSYEVEAVRLDDFCSENNLQPNFITMDIEGAEPEAIEGATDILSKHRPRFGICIYHGWTQRWTIPLRLKELCPDYNFFVKKSNVHGQTVLLGTPAVRCWSK